MMPGPPGCSDQMMAGDQWPVSWLVPIRQGTLIEGWVVETRELCVGMLDPRGRLDLSGHLSRSWNEGLSSSDKVWERLGDGGHKPSGCLKEMDTAVGVRGERVPGCAV